MDTLPVNYFVMLSTGHLGGKNGLLLICFIKQYFKITIVNIITDLIRKISEKIFKYWEAIKLI